MNLMNHGVPTKNNSVIHCFQTIISTIILIFLQNVFVLLLLLLFDYFVISNYLENY